MKVAAFPFQFDKLTMMAASLAMLSHRGAFWSRSMGVAQAFSPRILRSSAANHVVTTAEGSPTLLSTLHVYHSDNLLADIDELLVGGQRYEMSPIPDSMMQTTIFVGNLCEFVSDDDLSQLFRSVSSLQSLPACVVRKPDMTSLQYGFVTFPTVEEKEAALLRFHGYQLKGRILKVESVKDHPKRGRVRLPESMIAYVSGAVKTTSRGYSTTSSPLNSLRRISRDDVERLSRGQPAKKKGAGSRNVPHRLNDMESQEMQRAQKKGFVSLIGSGNRRSRKGSPLKNIHRQWCDARGKPQITLYKSRGSESKLEDIIQVDLSPLRLAGIAKNAEDLARSRQQYELQIEAIAGETGMTRFVFDDDEEDENDETNDATTLDEKLRKVWASEPIWNLPMIVFQFTGQRSQAKKMAKELAQLWDLPELEKDPGSGGPQSRRSAGAKKGGRNKMRGLSQHRKRGGGHRQSFY